MPANLKMEFEDDGNNSIKKHKRHSASYKEAKLTGICLIGFFLSIVGLFLAGILFGLLAFIFGIIGLTKISQHPDKYKGKGWGIVAMILGFIDIIGALIFLSRNKP